MKKVQKTMALFLALCLTVTALCLPVTAADLESKYGEPINFEYKSDADYSNYLKLNESMPSPIVDISLKAADATARGEGDFQTVSLDGRDNAVMFPEQSTWMEWTVNVEEEGMYSIGLVYNTGADALSDIDVKLKINGEEPFNQASRFLLFRVWEDTSDILFDNRGNNLKPESRVISKWQYYEFNDLEGLFYGAFQFHLNAGANTITLETDGRVLYVDEIKVFNKEPLKSYNQVKAEYSKKGYKEVTDKTIKFQAETPTERSHSTIYAVADKTSPSTEPADPSKIRLNTIGGENWQTYGYWISWDFDVEEDGLYNISLKYKQDILSGLFTSRKVYIDDEIPFSELEQVRFGYGDDWQMKTLGNDDEDFLFYLDKGKHSLKMEVTYGDMAEVIRKINDELYVLNDMYYRIIMISGSSPDKYRDYKFENKIENLVETFTGAADNLQVELDKLRELSGGNGKELSVLEETIYEIRAMAADPSIIKNKLENYKTNISSLSSWIFDVMNQPLQLDYITIHSSDIKLQKASAGFWKSFWFGVQNFFYSFVEDYNIISNENTDKKSVKVWVSLGRDQVGVLKDLIVGDFTPKTGIDIQLELVQGSLIEATLAGRGPDVALMVGVSDPVNYAIRGALVDLSQFPDFEEYTSENFHPSSLAPFYLQGGYYAIPDTQTFDMLFYRKDILTDLGLGVPNTWDQFKRMVPIINQNNMIVGFAASNATQLGSIPSIFSAMLYQNGGSYYKENRMETAFDSDIAKEAFKEMTDYYVTYEFPLSYDFYSRFRTGELPLAITGYTTYNQLSVAAPEIKGLWDMAPIPGTVQEDGTLSRKEASTVAGCIMFKKTVDKESAWEFMKWFTSPDIQASYGTELEKIMGPAARYATANVHAFEKLPWSLSEQEKIKEQWDEIVGIPEIPGSYYTTRGLQNAYRTVVNEKGNPYEALAEWNRDINAEIIRKHKEFGLYKEEE